MTWNDSDILAYQSGQTAFADQTVANHDYLAGVGFGSVDRATSGRLGLGILSVAILGVMFFYIATRSRQL